MKPDARALSAVSPVRFARVSLPPGSTAGGAALEVALPDGTVVRGSDTAAVAQLVRTLRG